MTLVMQEVPFESLLRHLEKSDERVLHSVLTVMNSLYAKASDQEKDAILLVIFIFNYAVLLVVICCKFYKHFPCSVYS